VTDADPAPILIGANPNVQLFDDSEGCLALASCWRVDWSVCGAGTAIVLWQPTGVTTYGEDAGLAGWLAEEFVRGFPELDGLGWSPPLHRPTPVEVAISMSDGMVASAAGLMVTASRVLDRRTFRTDDLGPDGTPRSLSLVFGPCATGAVEIDGLAVPGRARRSGTPDRPGSSAFVTEAEVWEYATRT
jgi:hypothetical protein